MARGDLEAHALAGLQQLTGGDALGFHAKGLQLLVEVFQRGFVQHLEGEEVDARLVSLAQHHAVVVAFGAGLEIGTALGIAAQLSMPVAVTICT